MYMSIILRRLLDLDGDFGGDCSSLRRILRIKFFPYTEIGMDDERITPLGQDMRTRGFFQVGIDIGDLILVSRIGGEQYWMQK